MLLRYPVSKESKEEFEWRVLTELWMKSLREEFCFCFFFYYFQLRKINAINNNNLGQEVLLP